MEKIYSNSFWKKVVIILVKSISMYFQWDPQYGAVFHPIDTSFIPTFLIDNMKPNSWNLIWQTRQCHFLCDIFLASVYYESFICQFHLFYRHLHPWKNALILFLQLLFLVFHCCYKLWLPQAIRKCNPHTKSNVITIQLVCNFISIVESRMLPLAQQYYPARMGETNW